MRELLAFAANAGLGFSLKPEHVQVPESMHTVYGAVGNGLRVLGQPCAEVSQIEAPQSGNSYRVTCRLAAGDEATVSYRLNPIARTEKNGDSSLLPAKVLLYYKVL
jgi:hypothetical protein